VANNLDKHFDALVIGGGIIGMLTARNLQIAGFSVAIFDKGSLGGEATWAAGGILSPLNPWQQNTATQSLIDEGKQNFAALAEELKHETRIDPEFIQSGMLVLDTDEKQQAIEWAKNNNEILQVLTNQTLLDQEKNISDSLDEALYLPNTAQIRPPRLISALQQSLVQRKIKILQNTCIEKFLIEGDSVTGVATKNESFYSDKVIVCSGAWTKNLLKEDAKFNVDIEPVRGQMLLYKLPQQILSHIILRNNSYLVPRQDGHILCGSTIEHVGFKNDITQEARQELQGIAHHLVPLLAEHEPIKQWSGLRPGTQRDKPYICKHPKITGLYLNSGHYRYGILMSIASARIMAELVVNSLNT
jgi:glycine oxidase